MSTCILPIYRIKVKVDQSEFSIAGGVW